MLLKWGRRHQEPQSQLSHVKYRLALRSEAVESSDARLFFAFPSKWKHLFVDLPEVVMPI